MSDRSIFKIMVYNRRSWKTLWILLTNGIFKFNKIDELIAKNSEAQTGCPVTYAYTAKTVGQLLSGFKIIDTQIDHIFCYKIEDYKNYLYKKVWYFRYLPKPFFRFLGKHFGWHICVTVKIA